MKKIMKLVGFTCITSISVYLIIFLGKMIYHTYQYNNNNYYMYYKNDQVNFKETTKENTNSNEPYTTVIDHTTKYSNQKIITPKDAIALIKKEAQAQEAKCHNDLSIIEKEIEVITGIYGINLCELSKEQAAELKTVLEYIYTNYPIIKEYLTNITLVNDGGTSSYIAAFKPSFTFATSNNSNKFPFVIKMQVFLNASYFLNTQYFNSIIKIASDTHHFPKDTTQASLIVHEFGHVLTYVLAIKEQEGTNTIIVKFNEFKTYSDTLKEYTTSNFSKKIVTEAYQRLLKEKNETLEEFQKNISGYASSEDEYGNMLYNETIAEAFHDYYLHQNNAKKESIAIMDIITEYIEKFS